MQARPSHNMVNGPPDNSAGNVFCAPDRLVTANGWPVGKMDNTGERGGGGKQEGSRLCPCDTQHHFSTGDKEPINLGKSQISPLFFTGHSNETITRLTGWGWPNVGLMVGHRFRRWPTIRPTFGADLQEGVSG